MTELIFDLLKRGYTVTFYSNDAVKDCLFIRIVNKNGLAIDNVISRQEYDAVNLRNDLREPEYLLKLYIKNMVQELENSNV